MKKLISAICAFALAAALPTLAFASPSGENHDVDFNSASVPVTITLPGGVAAGDVTVADATSKAINTPSDSKVIKSIEITSDDIPAGTKLPMTFKLGLDSGTKVTVYIEHTDGTPGGYQKLTVAADGSVSFTVDGLSIFTFVEGWPADGTANTGTDKSPQTGVDMALVGGIAIVAAVAACGVAIARKKVTE